MCPLLYYELARSDAKRLKSSLEMFGHNVLHEMLTNNIPLEELGWALAKAAIKEEENYAGFMAIR